MDSKTDKKQLPELRLMHEMGTRSVHYFKRIPRGNVHWHSRAYYECECGAQADRYGRVLPEVIEA